MELHKQLDQIQLLCTSLEHEKRRLSDELQMVKSKSKIEIESYQKQLSASKEHCL